MRAPLSAMAVEGFTCFAAMPSSATCGAGPSFPPANEPADPSVVHFFGPYLYRSAFYASTPEEESQRALEHLEQTIILEGASTIGAILIETIVGTNGVLIPPPGYLEGVREMCDKYGIVWIADEVMVGFGRVGEWFAFQGDDSGVVPDLITFAKGINSGYVPLGGVVISHAISEAFDDRVFPDPERFDITRTPNPHLAFSHGISHCIGAPLAKIQLAESYHRLLTRIPDFRLDVAEDAIPMLTDTEKEKLGGGVSSLPIAW